MLNRHLLIGGATGTGKTVTVQRIIEAASERGTSVIVADVKGDLSGLAAPSALQAPLQRRAAELQIPLEPRAAPVVFWDVFGLQGHPLRATVSAMGPVLMARLLDCNSIQAGILEIAFAIADSEGLLLLDLDDLAAVLSALAADRARYQAAWGSLPVQSLATMQRRVIALREGGAGAFFGEPAIHAADFIARAPDGRGLVHVLAADRLILQPQLYAAVLLWLLSELYEDLPEVGDLPAPKLLLVLDEAHLLFKDVPRVVLDRVEQVVRLIRSKGVGVAFVTQNPMDLPAIVSAQLGNRIQHGLRAYTPGEAKVVRAVAETFVQNPALDLKEVLVALGVGEALVSCLEDSGMPAMAQRVKLRPPQSRVGPLETIERLGIMTRSPYAGRYEQALDRDSAAEVLERRAQASAVAAAAGAIRAEQQKRAEMAARAAEKEASRPGLLAHAMRAATQSAARQAASALVRGVLGGLRR